MLIGLDARTIYSPIRRGTAKNLIDLYKKVLELRPEWACTAYHRQPGNHEQPEINPSFQPKRIEMPGDRVDAWQRWRLPMAAWRDGIDLLHCPANTCPSWMPTKTLVTIHDLIPLDMPQGRPQKHVWRFSESVRTACTSAAGIICPSDYTADRLVNEFDARPESITVIPWASDTSVSYIPEQDRAQVLEQYNVNKKFVIHFGAAAPRKNTRRLIAAWAMIPPEYRKDWNLLIVGLDRQTYRRMILQVESLGLEDSVILHGFADEADIPTLLSAASILAYPSISEGFGLPILDAWTTKTAVLCGNLTSLPEVAGNAALLVDPLDAVDIADGLEELMVEDHSREELVQMGLTRVKEYNWDTTARAFIDAVMAAKNSSINRRLAAA